MVDRDSAWKKYQARLKAIRASVRSLLKQASEAGDAKRIAALKAKLDR
jgi:hypothetical protein